jgi:hypothetical protein
MLKASEECSNSLKLKFEVMEEYDQLHSVLIVVLCLLVYLK